MIPSVKIAALKIAGSFVKKGLSRSEALRKAWKIAKQSAAERVTKFKNRLLSAFPVGQNKKLVFCLRILAKAGKGFYSKVAASVLKYRKISEKQAVKLANGLFQLERAGLL